MLPQHHQGWSSGWLEAQVLQVRVLLLLLVQSFVGSMPLVGGGSD